MQLPRVFPNLFFPRIDYTITSIWRENILVFLSSDISCYSKLTVFFDANDAFGKLFSHLSHNVLGTNFRARSILSRGYCLYIKDIIKKMQAPQGGHNLVE